jgi:hypothetical protein
MILKNSVVDIEQKGVKIIAAYGALTCRDITLAISHP